MPHKIVQYQVVPERVDDIVGAIHDFVTAIRAEETATHYEAFQATDKVTFFHTMTFPTEEAEHAHQRAPHTAEFVARLYPHCVSPPTFTDVVPVADTDH